MIKRKKYCRYCGDMFYSKRIDAQYCSDSCRGMGYRAKWNTQLYDDSMKVEFHLRSKDYLNLIEEGSKIGFTAEEYARLIVFNNLNQNNHA